MTGRPKHIYSIYRKLARKDLTLKELFDIRGVRVLVNDVKDCYTVLGLVHNLWTPLPREFDDYIAKPKPNNYRSLHTAVVGPDGKVLEVQIRTYEMHQQGEYGVAAHWRYKEQPAQPKTRQKETAARRNTADFDERIAWLRQILDWRDGLASVSDLAEHFRTGLFEDTVYVLTPQGRVIDLPKGSTPVDFAYHVHSELGHRCRGAKVDAEMVPLNRALDNGQTVEILAAKAGGPSRDWLNPELGFIHSSRARAKVRQWFNNQNLEAAVAQGRHIVEKLLQREAMAALALDKLAAHLHFARVEDFLAAVGRTELTGRQLATAAHELAQSRAGAAPLVEALHDLQPSHPPAPAGRGDILVVGVDKLLTALARCCRPAPPDPIIGFVTRGRGVSVHRRSCPNVVRLPQDRLIDAQWGADAEHGSFPVDIEVEGSSHPDLMRALLDLLAREKARVLGARSTSRAGSAPEFHARSGGPGPAASPAVPDSRAARGDRRRAEGAISLACPLKFGPARSVMEATGRRTSNMQTSSAQLASAETEPVSLQINLLALNLALGLARVGDDERDVILPVEAICALLGDDAEQLGGGDGLWRAVEELERVLRQAGETTRRSPTGKRACGPSARRAPRGSASRRPQHGDRDRVAVHTTTENPAVPVNESKSASAEGVTTMPAVAEPWSPVR